jgi:hypothetical protein
MSSASAAATAAATVSMIEVKINELVMRRAMDVLESEAAGLLLRRRFSSREIDTTFEKIVT